MPIRLPSSQERCFPFQNLVFCSHDRYSRLLLTLDRPLQKICPPPYVTLLLPMPLLSEKALSHARFHQDTFVISLFFDKSF